MKNGLLANWHIYRNLFINVHVPSQINQSKCRHGYNLKCTLYTIPLLPNVKYPSMIAVPFLNVTYFVSQTISNLKVFSMLDKSMFLLIQRRYLHADWLL